MRPDAHAEIGINRRVESKATDIANFRSAGFALEPALAPLTKPITDPLKHLQPIL